MKCIAHWCICYTVFISCTQSTEVTPKHCAFHIRKFIRKSSNILRIAMQLIKSILIGAIPKQGPPWFVISLIIVMTESGVDSANYMIWWHETKCIPNQQYQFFTHLWRVALVALLNAGESECCRNFKSQTF